MYTAYEQSGIDMIASNPYRTISFDLRPFLFTPIFSRNKPGVLKQGPLVSRMVPLSSGLLLLWIIVVSG
jgi:hypothetical protein